MNLRRHQTLTLRLLAASAGILSAAAFAAPAQANPVDDAFIAALNNAGVNYGDPVDAKALGQSVCPILAEPGGSFNTAVASVVARAQVACPRTWRKPSPVSRFRCTAPR